MRNNKLYPELLKAGSLSKLIDNEFEKTGSNIRTKQIDESKIPITYARIEKENRFSQITIVAIEKLYMFDFWSNGILLAKGSSDNIEFVCFVIDQWIASAITASELANRHTSIKVMPIAHSFETNNEVECAWQNKLKPTVSDKRDILFRKSDLEPFIGLAMNDAIVGKLFPFTSMGTLCLSRCTGYPYTCDLPSIRSTEKGQFEIYSAKGLLLGTGNAQEALTILKENLPKGIVPSIRGTADDLIND